MTYWDRPTLKARGKQVLKGQGIYWTSVLVMLVYSLLGGGGGSSGGAAASNQQNGSTSGGYDPQMQQFWDKYAGYIAIGIIVAIIVGIAWSFFVANVLTVGKNRYFLDIRSGSGQFSTLFAGFRNGRYMGTVKSMFAMTIRVFLWGLLFIIPGIIKSLEYWMVPYILAENPDIDPKRAMEISSRTTQGEKGNIFVLMLSFIGWMFLGAMACGVGMFFVMPYVESTYAELFGALRYKAEKEGYCMPGEIGMEPVVNTAVAPSAPTTPMV